MISALVQSTNRKIEEALEELPEEAFDDTKRYIRATGEAMMDSVIGLMYFRELLALKNHNGHKLLQGTMCLVAPCPETDSHSSYPTFALTTTLLGDNVGRLIVSQRFVSSLTSSTKNVQLT